jgi:hypothetical protein
MPTPSVLLAISCVIGIGSITVLAVAIRKRLWLEGTASVLLAGVVLSLLIPTFLLQTRSSSQPAAQAITDSDAQPADRAEAQARASTEAKASAEAQTAARRVSISLSDATAQGMVKFAAVGHGLDSVKLTLTSRSPGPLAVTIPAGTILATTSKGVQNMVVREEQSVALDGPDAEVSLTVPAACVNMTLKVPLNGDDFTLDRGPAGGDLARLVNLASFRERTFRVQQFAIWTITDNPMPGEYVGIGSFGVGSGPSSEELQLVRALFAEAGISTNKYRALR